MQLGEEGVRGRWGREGRMGCEEEREVKVCVSVPCLMEREGGREGERGKESDAWGGRLGRQKGA